MSRDAAHLRLTNLFLVVSERESVLARDCRGAGGCLAALPLSQDVISRSLEEGNLFGGICL
jgi:hypothetical protein